MTIVLYEGDSRDVLRGMIERGEFVDSAVMDPPYGLKSVTKRFGKQGSKPAKPGRDGAFARQSKGFMGKVWDGTEIERDPEFWKLVYAVMKPGAYIVAFSSSRTYHHMAVAIERAGFVTHPMIGWTFASGMPKAHNAARVIDKALGVNGTVVSAGDPVRRIRPCADQNKDGTWEKLDDREYQPGRYTPGSIEGKQWEGWHYGGQARKPALEPIYVGQKPFSEKNGALNILKHGVGAVNIDGCRVPISGSGEEGRWPANLIHDGSPEVVALFPTSKGARAPVKGTEPSDNTKDIYGKFAGRVPGQFYGDQEGSAARFFEGYLVPLCFTCGGNGEIYYPQTMCSDPALEQCPDCKGESAAPSPFDGSPIFHAAKANKRDRAGSKHPTVKSPGLMRSLIRHVTPPGGIVLDPFAGSGSTGQAARDEGMRAILIELEPQYVQDIRRRLGLSDPAFDDLLGCEALHANSTKSGSFSELLG